MRFPASRAYPAREANVNIQEIELERRGKLELSFHRAISLLAESRNKYRKRLHTACWRSAQVYIRKDLINGRTRMQMARRNDMIAMQTRRDG
eukprot:6211343-Pleurochrysis_carterae.AAC.5